MTTKNKIKSVFVKTPVFLGVTIGFNFAAQAHVGQGPGLPSSCNQSYTGVRIHQLSLITEAEKCGGTP